MTEAAREARRRYDRKYYRMRRMKENGVRPLSIKGDEDLMRTRERGFEYYGFTEEEAKRLLAYCQDHQKFEEHELLLKSAKAARKEIASLLYFSIANNCSWEKLDKICYIPFLTTDFYAYRRKTLALFRDALIQCGKWDVTGSMTAGKDGDKQS